MRKKLRKCLVVSDIFCNFVSGNKGKKIARKQTHSPIVYGAKRKREAATRSSWSQQVSNIIKNITKLWQMQVTFRFLC
jgi:hypothetical protein